MYETAKPFMSKKTIIMVSIFIAVVAIASVVGLISSGEEQGAETVGANSAFTGMSDGTTQSTGWQRRCADEAKQKCEAFIAVYVIQNESPIRLIEVALSKNAESQTGYRMAIILPLGVMTNKSVGLGVDNKGLNAFVISQCAKSGCVAMADVETDTIDKMKAGQEINVTFIDGKSKPVNVILPTANLASHI